MNQQITRDFEGKRLKKYRDVADKWTIGIGHLITTGESYEEISEEECEEIFKKDCQVVRNHVYRLIKVPLTPNQMEAIVDFTFNLGAGSLAASTLRMKLNRKDYLGAADEFLKWNKARVKGILVPVAGLTRRRIAERNLFLSN